jgi:hypothetical protein
MGLMAEGDRWELYHPGGARIRRPRGAGSGSIKPGDARVFTIEIEQIMR